MLKAYSSEHLLMDASEVWELFIETHLILEIQTTFTLQELFTKTYDGITKKKMKVASPI